MVFLEFYLKRFDLILTVLNPHLLIKIQIYNFFLLTMTLSQVFSNLLSQNLDKKIVLCHFNSQGLIWAFQPLLCMIFIYIIVLLKLVLFSGCRLFKSRFDKLELIANHQSNIKSQRFKWLLLLCSLSTKLKEMCKNQKLVLLQFV